jgi:molecular chaperone IbpA
MTLTTFNKLRPFSVGFDNIFDQFDRLLDTPAPTYPPYNLIKSKDGDNYKIQIALAGFDKSDVDVEVKENTLTVKSKKDTVESEEEVLYKGISTRSFERSWTLADDMKVHGAKFENGLLEISLERIIPEEKKPKTIDIQ